MAGNLLSQITGAGLDKMGRPGVVAIQSLLTGESTGEWHITVGNPSNPIIMIGNLKLEGTDIELYGPLGVDDFPTKLKVTCKLSPARPRDRTEIMGMFSRNTRTYLTSPPQATKYSGNLKSGGQNGGRMPKGQDKQDFGRQVNFKNIDKGMVSERFPNHKREGGSDNVVTESAKGIG